MSVLRGIETCSAGFPAFDVPHQPDLVNRIDARALEPCRKSGRTQALRVGRLTWFYFLLIASLAAKEPVREFGRIVAARVIGEVSVVDNEDGAETPLHNNDLLYEGYSIVTAAQASAVLVFSNGASVRVLPNTRVSVDSFRQDALADDLDVAKITAEPSTSSSQLDLAYGELVCSVHKLSAGSSFNIHTPIGATGIRGTQFRLMHRELDGNLQQFSLGTLEGRVALTDASGHDTVEVPAGKELGGRLRSGQKPRFAKARPRDISASNRKLIEHNTAVMREAAKPVHFKRTDGKAGPGKRPKLHRDPAQRRDKDNDLQQLNKENPDWGRSAAADKARERAAKTKAGTKGKKK